MVFGGANVGETGFVDLSELDGRDGFFLSGTLGSGQIGSSVDGAGDINNDGFDDIVIGARDALASVGVSIPGSTYIVFGQADEFPATVNLDNLNGEDGLRIDGINSGDQSGTSVSRVGDCNNDGFDDVIIGAPGADPDARDNAGESYLIFGTDQAFPPLMNLGELDGNNGLIVNGVEGKLDLQDNGDGSGRSVSSVGDINADGFADLLIAAPGADFQGQGNFSGEVYLVFGNSEGFDNPFNLDRMVL